MAETAAEQAERERVAQVARVEQERLDRVETDMDAAAFVVVDHYVTLKVRDQIGAFQVRGFNEGGTVKRDDIDDESLRHHLDNGQLAPVGSDRARFAAPAGTPKPGEPPNVPVTETPVATLSLDERIARQAEAADAAEDAAERGGRPGVRAPKEDWVAFAVSKRPEGQSEEDARAVAEGKSKADLVAEFGS
jgi:hypothetical protein